MSSSAQQLHQALAPVCGRLRRRSALHAAVRGLAVGAAVAFIAALARVAVSGVGPLIVALAAVVAFPLLAAALSYFSQNYSNLAARAIDNHYGLQDRTLTALGLSQQTNPAPMAQLQLRDALAQLQRRQRPAKCALASCPKPGGRVCYWPPSRCWSPGCRSNSFLIPG